MPYEIQLVAERRWSLKILAHKIKRYFPLFVYEWMLWLRYASFTRRCKDLDVPQITYSDGSWTGRKTTADLRRILDFLRSEADGLRVLQIGIGNSSLFSEIGERCASVTGLTISEDEVEWARQKFPSDFDRRYDVRLMNKYSHEIASIGGGYDYIVDNDLSSYACCRHHFDAMLLAYRDMLAPQGSILVGINGLGYFDSGFGLTAGMMSDIAVRHGLVFVAGVEFHQLRLIAAHEDSSRHHVS
jgi:hypothetical protein